MPNWCANRLMFNGIKNSDVLKRGLLEAGCPCIAAPEKKVSSFSWLAARGYCDPLTEQHYAAYPQLVTYGVAAETGLQCRLDSHIAHARWDTLSEPELSIIRQLYQQKSCDWGDSFRLAVSQ